MNDRPNARPRVLVLDCGGIGGVLACHLREVGVDLTIATTNEAVREAWTTTGPWLDGRATGRSLPAERLVSHPREGSAPFDVVFLAVQPPQIDEAALSLKDSLTATGRVVCLPNGLCEDRVARVIGGERVIGAVVAWGARMPEPGRYLQTSSGGFRVGAYDGSDDPNLPTITRLLETVGPVKITHNLRGARFSKLAINCAVSTLGTIGGRTLGELLVRADARDIALEILREAVYVARADGVRIEPVIHLDLDWLAPRSGKRGPARRFVEHALLLGVGVRYRRMRSSMLAAMERGRAPAVDFLNGEIVWRGEAHGVPTPMNRAARDVVWEIARGERAAGIDSLLTVAERARAAQPASEALSRRDG